MTDMRKWLVAAWCCLLATVAAAQTDAEKLNRWMAGQTVSQEAVDSYGLEHCFAVKPVGQDLMRRMRGRSYPADCTIPAGQLRYVRALHRRADGTIGIGELVCHSSIAAKLRDIFRQLYEQGYPIERMVLIDNYNASDEKSMTANNTSCFCFRKVAGTAKLSNHAKGLAIDINPLYNPQVKGSRVLPKAGTPWADRSKPSPYQIVKGDLCYRLFTEAGFRWGGNWRTTKDYQHFEY